MQNEFIYLTPCYGEKEIAFYNYSPSFYVSYEAE